MKYTHLCIRHRVQTIGEKGRNLGKTYGIGNNLGEHIENLRNLMGTH